MTCGRGPNHPSAIRPACLLTGIPTDGCSTPGSDSKNDGGCGTELPYAVFNFRFTVYRARPRSPPVTTLSPSNQNPLNRVHRCDESIPGFSVRPRFSCWPQNPMPRTAGRLFGGLTARVSPPTRACCPSGPPADPSWSGRAKVRAADTPAWRSPMARFTRSATPFPRPAMRTNIWFVLIRKAVSNFGKAKRERRGIRAKNRGKAHAALPRSMAIAST